MSHFQSFEYDKMSECTEETVEDYAPVLKRAKEVMVDLEKDCEESENDI